jgi:hypothetical protein
MLYAQTNSFYPHKSFYPPTYLFQFLKSFSKLTIMIKLMKLRSFLNKTFIKLYYEDNNIIIIITIKTYNHDNHSHHNYHYNTFTAILKTIVTSLFSLTYNELSLPTSRFLHTKINSTFVCLNETYAQRSISRKLNKTVCPRMPNFFATC